MGPRRQKTERTAAEPRADLPGGPEPVPRAARPRAGTRCQPVRPRPAPREAALGPGKEQGRDPRDPRKGKDRRGLWKEEKREKGENREGEEKEEKADDDDHDDPNEDDLQHPRKGRGRSASAARRPGATSGPARSRALRSPARPRKPRGVRGKGHGPATPEDGADGCGAPSRPPRGSGAGSAGRPASRGNSLSARAAATGAEEGSPEPREDTRARSSESPEGDWQLRKVLDRLRLRRKETQEAANQVNEVVKQLLRALQTSKFRGVSQLSAGSYYEHVKVLEPNEFDIMFKLEVPRIQLEEYSNCGAYYFVKLKRNPRGSPLKEFVEGEFLSASKMLSEFREVIKKEIKNIEDVVVMRKKPGSPAVTLLIRKSKEISVDIILALESKSSWPAKTKDGLPIKKWLGTKERRDLRAEPFYLVPKHAKEGESFQEETWRLSFSHIEKDILTYHGASRTCCEAQGEKCCRKECLKLMKYLLEKLKKKFEKQKMLSKFCSYHVKTAFFHLCSKYSQDKHWEFNNLQFCFNNCVEFFIERLREGELEHYFISGFNLFSKDNIDTKSTKFLLKQIEHERNNGFPIFGEF